MIINTDASFNQDKRIGRTAVIIKNDEGEILDKIVDHMSCNDSSYAEIRAIMDAVNYLYENIDKDHNITIITDFQALSFLFNHTNFIEKINGNGKNNKISKKAEKEYLIETYMKLQILKIKNKIEIVWTPRKNNKEADKLSKMYK